MSSPVRRGLTDGRPSIVVRYASAVDEPVARRWARFLDLTCVGSGEPADAELSLVQEGGALWLRDDRHRGSKPLQVNFEQTASRSKKQPLGRAVGRNTRTVVDATAGWGEDARRLCAMGYAVTAVERSPVMAALLSDAAGRAGPGAPEIVAGDAIEFLARHPGRWDCVYLDPMFPPKRRASTLAKRPLRLLRELVGDDPDRGELFAAARSAAAGRVVVKRPDHAGPAFGRPAETMQGKLVCYDVYFVNRTVPPDG